MLRLVIVGAAIAGITATLIPLQWLSLKLGLPTQRTIPVAYHRMLCRLMGVRVRAVGAPARAARLLIVANHVSWLDISVLISLAPVVFVAKQEVARWPLFGLLARLNRSVFVDRNRRHKTAAVNREIAARMAAGDPVVLFAEGTSGDGNRVLPFRSSLIGAVEAALEQDRDGELCVQPLSIAYTGLDGLPLGRQHRPHVAWYGAMDLLPHLANILRRGAVDVVVSWGEPTRIAPGTDRKALTRALETEVRRLTAHQLRQRG
ncbi:MAG: 1-acyl-sn-glycerol-3-phosphate acyltransferase [Variibacter sp.]|nr:1-acyl-sn-glycerol-3-phosphate acyltransferase [Variibacter sp.]